MRWIVALALLGTLGPCVSWGPLTHQSVCSFGWLPPTAPNISVHFPSFVLGCSSPDAFNQNPPVPPPQGWKGNWPLHSFEFAGYQLLYALTAPGDADFDPISFALGYGAHLAMDAVAHNPNGFIAVKGPEYELELAVDTLELRNASRFVFFPKNSAEFIANATMFYSSKGGPVHYATKNIAEAQSLFDAALHGEDGVLAANFGYKHELVHHSRYNATSFEQVETELRLALACSAAASTFWISHLLSSRDVDAAHQATTTLVDHWFSQGGVCGHP